MVRLRDARGFTLVEVLVVILIVGLLAGIAVPTFLTQKDKGQDVGAKHLAGVVVRAMAIYRSEHDGSYACGSDCVDDLRDLDRAIPASGIAISEFGSGGGTPSSHAFRVTVDSPSGRRFWVDKDVRTGDHLRGCAAPGGGCADGSW
jgi:prepilin-type N-terminal cleavage/methylation domain-containing protein